MSTLLEYKCPCCGGAIEFDSTLQKMKCPYCNTEFDVDTLKSLDEDLDKPDETDWQTQAGSEWQTEEADELRSYVCKSCGGEIVCDKNTAATSCPFCDNPVVMAGNLSGTLKPDYIIPFKLDKKAAKSALAKHLTGKRLLPKIFKDSNHIDEIKGVYVPFWLFDTNVSADMRYKATRVRIWSDSRYDYTETSFFSVRRGGSMSYERVPVDGSSKMADDIMESIEPYDFADAVEFKTAYLAGYYADKYDVTAQQSIERANERIKRSTEQAIADSVHGYASVIPDGGNVRFSDGHAKYALYPVWLLNTTWQDKRYVFAMNGQTGKFVGDLPVDKRAYTKWLLGLTAVFGAVSLAVSVILWLI